MTRIILHNTQELEKYNNLEQPLWIRLDSSVTSNFWNNSVVEKLLISYKQHSKRGISTKSFLCLVFMDIQRKNKGSTTVMGGWYTEYFLSSWKVMCTNWVAERAGKSRKRSWKSRGAEHMPETNGYYVGSAVKKTRSKPLVTTYTLIYMQAFYKLAWIRWTKNYF